VPFSIALIDFLLFLPREIITGAGWAFSDFVATAVASMGTSIQRSLTDKHALI